MLNCDAAVVGGGVVGAAIAYGLAELKLDTILIDEGDVAFRAARGNFGLVWVQSKGIGCPPYSSLTRRSADNWPRLAAQVKEVTGVDLAYGRQGGVHLCLGEQEFKERSALMKQLKAETEGHFQFEMLDHRTLSELLPGLGQDVVGGSYSSLDGHANPLFLLRGLHAGFRERAGRALINAPVHRIRPHGGVFDVEAGNETVRAQKLVLAAGLANAKLAPEVGLRVPVHPLRGQILVSEKVRSFLRIPTLHVRQTSEGSVLMGDSHEDVGFDDGTRPDIMVEIARRATRAFPFLRSARIVRAWGALRVMTPDGIPIYDQSASCPGAFCASAHSGITLAATHAFDFPRWIVAGELPPELGAFSARRFDVH